MLPVPTMSHTMQLLMVLRVSTTGQTLDIRSPSECAHRLTEASAQSGCSTVAHHLLHIIKHPLGPVLHYPRAQSRGPFTQRRPLSALSKPCPTLVAPVPPRKQLVSLLHAQLLHCTQACIGPTLLLLNANAPDLNPPTCSLAPEWWPTLLWCSPT
jgi:hypothetical protein